MMETLSKDSREAQNSTEAGRVFLNEARAVLERVVEAVQKARAVAVADDTELHVGYSRGIALS
jgi:DNA-binding transcriptional LysR family regulator